MTKEVLLKAYLISCDVDDSLHYVNKNLCLRSKAIEKNHQPYLPRHTAHWFIVFLLYSIAIKSEGPVASTTIATSHSHPTGGDPCHLMSHFPGLEPDMLHPALRSIELGGGMEDEDEDNGVSEEQPTTANSHQHHHHHHRAAMESLEHQLHTSLPSFNSLHLPDPVQRPQ